MTASVVATDELSLVKFHLQLRVVTHGKSRVPK
jgi:hypothetical protein